MKKFYLIDVVGSIDPALLGPFETDAKRDEQARLFHKAQRDDDALFWLDVKDGEPSIGSYTGEFFKE